MTQTKLTLPLDDINKTQAYHINIKNLTALNRKTTVKFF